MSGFHLQEPKLRLTKERARDYTTLYTCLPSGPRRPAAYTGERLALAVDDGPWPARERAHDAWEARKACEPRTRTRISIRRATAGRQGSAARMRISCAVAGATASPACAARPWNRRADRDCLHVPASRFELVSNSTVSHRVALFIKKTFL